MLSKDEDYLAPNPRQNSLQRWTKKEKFLWYSVCSFDAKAKKIINIGVSLRLTLMICGIIGVKGRLWIFYIPIRKSWKISLSAPTKGKLNGVIHHYLRELDQENCKSLPVGANLDILSTINNPIETLCVKSTLCSSRATN